MSKPYHPVARGLHWLMALLLAGMVALGVYMTDLPLSPEKFQLYSWHKWAGVTAFALVCARLAWRAFHPAPALPSTLSTPARLAAQAGHLALYALMVAIPLTGWLMSSAKGFQTVWFGVLPIPDLLAADPALGERLAQLHERLNWLMVALVAGHVGAALYHQFVLRDGTLRRMVPASRAPQA
jgi:cytochrome b561